MYGKVFRSLWEGSLMGRSDAQLVLVYLIAHADSDGFVSEPTELIAFKTGLPPATVASALELLSSPDPSSRTKAKDGRRIEWVENADSRGWQIVNHAKYRAMRNFEDRQRQNREAQARHKDAKRSAKVSRGKPRKAHTETETETETSTPLAPLAVRVGMRLASNQRPLSPNELSAMQAFAEVFWPAYPRKIGRIAAEKAWLKLGLSDDDDAALEAIMRGLSRYKAKEWADRPDDKIPHAATWINQRRWEDFCHEATAIA